MEDTKEALEEAKKDFKENYSKAVEDYNAGKYRGFFMYIRLCIELFSKLLIYEFSQDEKKAQKLIAGDETIINDPSRGGLSFSSKKVKAPGGSALMSLFKKVYSIKHPEADKWLKNGVDSLGSTLSSFYSIASEMGSHSGNSPLDAKVQATSCTAFLLAEFDFLRKKEIISQSFGDFLNSLDKFSVPQNAPAVVLSNDAKDVSQTPKEKLDQEVTLDKHQEVIDNKPMEQSELVVGCAGSGKSILAMKRAEKLAKDGTVIVIAFTNTLTRYMEKEVNGDKCQIFVHNQWQKLGKPHADYIIVDEIQDFTEEEIREFTKAAEKAYFFYGDSAQSIYETKSPFNNSGTTAKPTLNIKQISKLTGLTPMSLHTNYRLPADIAKITQDYIGVQIRTEKFSPQVYKSPEKQIPAFIKCQDESEQTDNILKIIEKHKEQTIGILLPNNDLVEKTFKSLEEKIPLLEIKCTYKDKNGKKTVIDTLCFDSINPKIMTYHSAKGLQFDVVILPQYEEATSKRDLKRLYVAMTRTMKMLYVLYCGDLSAPLKNVPTNLYKKKI